jgi:hypothetical protein
MRTTCMVTLFLLGFFVFAAAEEYPVTENAGLVTDITSSPPAKIENKSTFASAPARAGLEGMTLAEKENSFINIELATGVPVEAYQLAGRIEDLWNIGDFTKALQLFPQLESLADGRGIAIGNTWRIPIETENDPLWFRDVRIGNHSGIFDNELDIHRASGNLFAVLAFIGGGNRHWSVNLSTDSGDSWAETYNWWADYDFIDVGAIVLDDYCYVGYIGNADRTETRLQRFGYVDGGSATFPNGSSHVTAFTTTGPIAEIALTSNQDYDNDRIYYYALLGDGTVSYFYDDADCMDFEEIDPGVTEARRGLSACTNENFGTYYTLFSYLTADEKVKIYGLGTDGAWSELVSYNVNSNSADYTSIGAYGDTITCVFDYFNGTVLTCRYLVSYSGGQYWLYGNVGRSPEIRIGCPALSARAGGGVAMIYRSELDFCIGHYIWRDYFGNWPYPTVYAEYALSYNQPDIEYMSGDDYGIVYLRLSDNRAFFNRQKPNCLEISVGNRGSNIVEPRDFLRIDGSITNNGITPVQTDLWYGVMFNDDFYRLGVYRNIPVDSNQTLSTYFWQQVPEHAPPGDYIFIAYAGKYSLGIVDAQDSFLFEVIPDRAGGSADAWNLSEGTIEFHDSADDYGPCEYLLIGNFPNPFNARTCIAFVLPEAGRVTLRIYNLAGRVVATLVNGYMEAGRHITNWDASPYSSGIYFYKLTADNQSFTKRMVLLR